MYNMIKPEGEYTFFATAGYQYFCAEYHRCNTVTGLVTGFIPEQKKITVKLSNTVTAEMPWEEATLYSLTPDRNIPKEIYSLRWEKIRIRITDISDGSIVVSRRENMLKTWETAIRQNAILNGKIIAAIENGVFYDVGEGLVAFCHYRDYSKCKFGKVDICIGSIDPIRIQNISEDYRLDVSRRAASCYDYSMFKVGDIVDIRISSPLLRNGRLTGAFAEISPNVSGIVDLRQKQYDQIQKGKILQAIIRKITEDQKINLRLI